MERYKKRGRKTYSRRVSGTVGHITMLWLALRLQLASFLLHVHSGLPLALKQRLRVVWMACPRGNPDCHFQGV